MLKNAIATKFIPVLIICLAVNSFITIHCTAEPAPRMQTGCFEPVFAGFFYDKDPRKLKLSLQRMLDKANADSEKSRRIYSNKIVTEPDRVIAAVVPHASYKYSGATAATFYSRMRGQSFSRIFILGPAHREHFHGCALPVNKYFCTPIGRLPIDTMLLDQLRKNALFKASYDLPRKEHSVEMQLPFIQHTFGNVLIVPIEVGNLDSPAEIRDIAQELKRFVTARDLVIVSSDFTHYGPRYNFQPFAANPLAGIEKLDREALKIIKERDVDAFLKFQKRTNDTICGLYPVAILLAMLPRQCNVTLIDYQNSSHINKAPDGNMVSYMAIEFTAEKSIRRKH